MKVLELYFFNVGHGDSIAIKFPNSEWGIVDCNKNTNELEPKVLKFLKQNNVKTLNFICITHPHQDHFYGFDDIINYFGSDKINQLILYGLKTGCGAEYDEKSDFFIGLSDYIKNIKSKDRKDKIKLIRENDVYNIGDVKITCFNPTDLMIQELQMESYIRTKLSCNNISVVLLLEYHGVKILLTGDVQGKIIKSKAGLLSDIIKIPHHGSYEYNDFDFLINAVRREKSHSIITAGKKYNLPDKNVIDYLKDNLHSEVYLTSEGFNNINSFEPQFKLSDISLNLLSELGDDELPENIIQPEGFIKFSIYPNGKIIANNFSTIEKIIH